MKKTKEWNELEMHMRDIEGREDSEALVDNRSTQYRIFNTMKKNKRKESFITYTRST